MDGHIKRFDGKPSDGFVNFIEHFGDFDINTNLGLYFPDEEKETINAMLKDDACQKKLKKTYKNRYFMYNKQFNK